MHPLSRFNQKLASMVYRPSVRLGTELWSNQSGYLLKPVLMCVLKHCPVGTFKWAQVSTHQTWSAHGEMCIWMATAYLMDAPPQLSVDKSHMCVPMCLWPFTIVCIQKGSKFTKFGKRRSSDTWRKSLPREWNKRNFSDTEIEAKHKWGKKSFHEQTFFFFS